MKLVPNWKQAWKWFSMQSMALSVALLGGWQALPADLKSEVPASWAMAVAIAILILGALGRLVDQRK